MRSTDVLAIREAVLSGMGVAADMPLVQIYEDLAEGKLVPILPGWSRPPVECYIVTNRDAWHMKRVRVFFEWFAAAMRSTFAGYERAVSSFVGSRPTIRLQRERKSGSRNPASAVREDRIRGE